MHTQPHHHDDTVIDGWGELRGQTTSPQHTPDVNPYPPTKICSQQLVGNVLPLPTSLRQEHSSQNVLCMHKT